MHTYKESKLLYCKKTKWLFNHRVVTLFGVKLKDSGYKKLWEVYSGTQGCRHKLTESVGLTFERLPGTQSAKFWDDNYPNYKDFSTLLLPCRLQTVAESSVMYMSIIKVHQCIRFCVNESIAPKAQPQTNCISQLEKQPPWLCKQMYSGCYSSRIVVAIQTYKFLTTALKCHW